MEDFDALAIGETVLVWYEPKISVYVKEYGRVDFLEANIELNEFCVSKINQLTAAIRRLVGPSFKSRNLVVDKVLLSAMSTEQILGDPVVWEPVTL
jgi:hypothetical protein